MRRNFLPPLLSLCLLAATAPAEMTISIVPAAPTGSSVFISYTQQGSGGGVWLKPMPRSLAK